MSVEQKIEVRVAEVRDEAEDIRSVEFISADGSPLPPFAAGAHIDVHLNEKMVRQYSLCNNPMERHRYVIAVLREAQGRGGSRAVHELKVGEVLQICGPRNHFELACNGNSLLIAGGIGVTPILSMAESLASAGRPFSMHYATQTRSRTAFRERIQSANLAPFVSHYWSREADSQRLDLMELLRSPAEDDHLYVCGPRSFMDSVIAAARNQGWPEAHIHYEFFAGDVVHLDSDDTFTVELASSGKTILVPQDKTVVEALSAAGIEIATSCEQGICGTCVTGVLKGVPDHRDMFLSPQEQGCNDKFLPCCSRSKSSVLVLDL